MDKFIRLFVNLTENPPALDSQLSDLVMWDGILNFLTNTYTNPNM